MKAKGKREKGESVRREGKRQKGKGRKGTEGRQKAKYKREKGQTSPEAYKLVGHSRFRLRRINLDAEW